MLPAFMAIDGAMPNPVRDSDECYEHLLSRIATGDTQALEQLYGLAKTAVYGFALSIVKKPQDAEDVMQDAFVNIFRGAAHYRPQGKPMAWILTIVRNQALTHLRAKANSTVSLEEASLPAEGGDFTLGSIDRMLLHAALDKLSDEERQVLALHCVSDLKHREIAKLLDIPLSTALSKYYRSLSKLKAHMKEVAI